MATNPYTDKTSFTEVVGGSAYVLLDELSSDDIQRTRKELKYWRFYRGEQWENKRPTGEAQNTLNYCRAFVDKGAAFLMGEGFTIDVPEQSEDIIKDVLKEVWEDNNKEVLAYEMAQSGGVTGDAWVKVAVETFDKEEDPDLYEIYPNGRIRIMVLPSYTVFPTWSAHDMDKMLRCRIIYPVIVEDTRVDGTISQTRTWYKEELTKDKIITYVGDRKIEEKDNALNEIPLIRIKNLPQANSSFGISDLADVVPIQKELNYKTTDISDIIAYHAAPITIVKGAKVSALEKGARKIWGGIPKDAEVDNLELKSDLKASMSYLDLLKTVIFELGRMPEDAFGKNTKISNTSGVALQIKNQPLLERTKTKQVTYGQGIKDINRLILKYAEIIEYSGFDIDRWKKLPPMLRYKTRIKFGNPLPKDKLVQMQLIAQKIMLKLMSRKDALIELGEDDAVSKLEEIHEEFKEFSDIFDGSESKSLTTNIGGIVDASEKTKQVVEDED